jgi:hypothetical protein
MSKPAEGYIVLFDNDELAVPMGWDADYAGALCCTGARGSVAVFADRQEARKAIRVSTAYAKLCKAAGKPANDDFLLNVAKQIHIVPLRSKPG